MENLFSLAEGLQTTNPAPAVLPPGLAPVFYCVLRFPGVAFS